MPLLTERELRKMSVRPIYAMSGGGLGSAVVFFVPIILIFGVATWWMLGYALACLAGLVGALVYVHRAP